MDIPRLSKSVREVSILQPDGSGGLSRVVIYKQKRKRKKMSRGFKPLERLVRMAARSSDAATGTYLRRHKRSNEKHRDGWARDLQSNSMKAGRKALKKIKPGRVFGF